MHNINEQTDIIGEHLNSVRESNELVAESLLEILDSSNTLVNKIEEVGENGIMSLGSIASNIESIENIQDTLVTKIEEVGEDGIQSLGSIASNIESMGNEISAGNNNNDNKVALDNIAGKIETLNLDGLRNINNGLTSVENEIRTSMLDMSKATEDSLEALIAAIRKVHTGWG